LKDINKNIIALGFVSFFTDMASSMVTSILPLYVVYVLHEGVDKLGFIVGIAAFVSYFFRFVFGYLSDRFQIVKPFVVAGYLLSAVTKPMLYFADGWVSVALLRGVERVGKAVRSATKDSLISAYSQKGKSGKTFGFHKSMDIAGELTGSIIAFGVLYYLGQSRAVFENIFAWTLLPGILAVVIVIFFVQDAPYKSKSTISKIDLSKDYALLPVLVLYFGFLFFMFSDAFYVIRAKESGISITYIPLLVILMNLMQTMFSYIFGINIDRVGAFRVLLLSFVLGIASMGALYFGYTILSFALLGLFTVSSLNAVRAYISANAANKGSIYGIFYAGVALSSALGASAIGLIWKHFGENEAILISLCGLIVMLTALLILIFKSKSS